MSRVLVLGAGVSGMAAARLARRLGMSVTIYAEEMAAEAIGGAFSTASGGWDRELLQGIDVIVASPGFAERSAPIVDALEWGVPIWSEIEFASRHLDAPVVAITGTNGKTTVTEATSAMLTASGLRAPATGNIGSALSDQVGVDNDLVVVEVSSFQLRFIDGFHPTAAAITNLAVDHLDWHGSAAAYGMAKRRIFENQTSSDLLVYDADDEGATSLALHAPGVRFPVSGTNMPHNGGGIDNGHLVVGEVSVPVADLTSADPIHLVNLASAAALALRSGGQPESVAAEARIFRSGSHRREVVASANGIVWIDDSKATNPHAAGASIRSHRSVILIAGGLDKGLDVTSLARERGVREVIGIGAAGPGLVAAAGERGHDAGDLETAVRLAAELAVEGDTVLLAPGCASFDQFVSYAERGDRFAELVRAEIGAGTR